MLQALINRVLFFLSFFFFVEPYETLQDNSRDGKGDVDLLHLHDQDSEKQI